MTDHAYRQKRSLIKQLWDDMGITYGRKWLAEDQAVEGRKERWLEAVSEFRTEDIRTGIMLARKRTDPFPPTLAEFRGLIEANRKRYTPDNGAGDVKTLERQGAKLLAGKLSGQRDRIIKRDEVYIHQVKKAGEWIDADWQKGGVDMLPMHRRLAG